jgi:hypothetical protein
MKLATALRERWGKLVAELKEEWRWFPAPMTILLVCIAHTLLGSLIERLILPTLRIELLVQGWIVLGLFVAVTGWTMYLRLGCKKMGCLLFAGLPSEVQEHLKRLRNGTAPTPLESVEGLSVEMAATIVALRTGYTFREKKQIYLKPIYRYMVPKD